MTDKEYLESGEFSICRNCGKDTSDSEEAGEGHTPDEYYYKCKHCGCMYTVSRDEVQHGLSGWQVDVEIHGDLRKHTDFSTWKESNKVPEFLLDDYDTVKDIEEEMKCVECGEEWAEEHLCEGGWCPFCCTCEVHE